MKFKVGDKIVKNNAINDDHIMTITEIISDNKIRIKCSCGIQNEEHYIDEFKLYKEGSMSKYDELKTRIENSKNGWDKEADDIFEEIKEIYRLHAHKLFDIGIRIYAEKYEGRICIFDSFNTLPTLGIVNFEFNSQCEKMAAFKSALLWLLDHSDIKKDERQEKVAELKKELAEFTVEINRKIEALEK